MDWIIWVIVIVVIVGVVWWLLNRNSSGNITGTSMSSDTGVSAPRTDKTGAVRPGSGSLAGGGAAASAEAAATTGMAEAAGFAAPAGPPPPTTTDDARDMVREAPAASAAVTAAPGTAVGGDVDDWDEDAPTSTETPAPAGTAQTAAQAGTGQAATGRTSGPEPTSAGGPSPEPGGSPEGRGAAASDKAQWEEQWSEAASTPHAAATPAADSTEPASATQTTAAPMSGTRTSGAQAPVHHPEYTEPHAPTLPGAESAAVEDILATDSETEAVVAPATGNGPAGDVRGDVRGETASPGDAETMQAAESSAATEAAASHTAEPTGHLAADQPYGEGSAAPGPDGRGPDGYTVKGNAQSMTYHDETSPAYEETSAEVWFESVAHAEAAGFRAPRRSRH